MSGETSYYYYDQETGREIFREIGTVDGLREALKNSNVIRIEIWHESFAPIVRVLDKSKLLMELEEGE